MKTYALYGKKNFSETEGAWHLLTFLKTEKRETKRQSFWEDLEKQYPDYYRLQLMKAKLPVEEHYVAKQLSTQD